MSTILDALKKIESDKRRELPERGLFEQVTKEEEIRPPFPVRPWRTWALVILLCAAVSVTTLVLTRSFTDPPPELQSPASISTTDPEYLDEDLPIPARNEVADARDPGQQADGMDAVRADRDEGTAVPADPPVDTDFFKESYSEPETVTRPTLPAGMDLKINAIVWSKNPKARFAMVNHKSVRKGDDIQGATVVEIMPDWIVFDYRGELFQVAIKR